ncbi:angiomotin-like protein 1 isoform X1 [Varroa destructor]|uniref:Angiomotin C-terminal domain-containing protein n=1 Tax=Varroa destructor TaxID=109461 RepID=A0A7M7JU69_VARDE|nr:angiomotin-like protein 1 isoform X1 [Varroa destructor]
MSVFKIGPDKLEILEVSSKVSNVLPTCLFKWMSVRTTPSTAAAYPSSTAVITVPSFSASYSSGASGASDPELDGRLSASQENLAAADGVVGNGTNANGGSGVNSPNSQNNRLAPQGIPPHGERQEPQGEETLIADELNNTLVIRNNASIDGYSSPFYGKAPPYPGLMGAQSTPMINNHKASTQGVGSQAAREVQEITEIPKHYLDNSPMLKHLAKEIQIQPTSSNGSPAAADLPSPSGVSMTPQAMPVGITNLQTLQGIQPIQANHQLSVLQMSVVNGSLPMAPAGQGTLVNMSQLGDITVPQDDNGNKIISLLSQENQALKAELDLCHTKISRLERMEIELQHLHEAQEEIVVANEKRERLETALRTRMEQEIQRLRRGLAASPAHADANFVEMQQELSRRDLLIAQLLGQNKELLCEKERKDVEIAAQTATLAEQRKHIEILDHALTNAQANIVRLEEEARKKEFYVERVHELQRALQQMQAASERRLEMEKRMRTELEKDVQSLGRNLANSGGDVEDLRKTIRDYEEKVVSLEGEVARWEQKYLEESALRQMAVDAASVPKDARIAALERNSVETERLISQVRSEKLRQMDELHAAHRRGAELESRLKDMESKLAERDAMIRVLQQRSSIHARAASSVALTHHHRRTGSKDETIPDRAAMDESLKEFGSRLANKASLLGNMQCGSAVAGSSSTQSSLQLASSNSKSTSNLISPIEVPASKLSISAASLEQNGIDGNQGDGDGGTVKVWCV